ncbi:MAG: DNA starvation/stationary phase protection protein [Phototrophicales bacterium]|nr:DNA starvation/stationary phase protection protein [Phototrophicales bacterium]
MTDKNMITPNLGLDEEVVSSVVKILLTALSDEMVLYTKLRNYHWNVTGQSFAPLHALFEAQYTQLEATIDELAERVRMYGAPALGTMSAFIKTARLQEGDGTLPDTNGMVANLHSDHEAMVRNLRSDIDALDELDDVGAEDMLTGLLQDHQKMAWFLRTYLENA